MGRRKGNTNARGQAMKDDCIKQIVDKNMGHNDWCRYCVEKYECTTRRAEMIWQDAWKIMRENFEKDRDEKLLQAVTQLDSLYAEATKKDYDFNSKINILKQKHRLLGLDVQKQEIVQQTKLSFDFQRPEEDSVEE